MASGMAAAIGSKGSVGPFLAPASAVAASGGSAESCDPILDKPGHELPPGEAERVADEVLAVMAHPDLAPLFGPDSRAEVPLTGVVRDSVVGGLVDRLVVLPDGSWSRISRPTGARPRAWRTRRSCTSGRWHPTARCCGDFPGRAVVCALIWTREARVAILPDERLDSHDPGHARDAA